LWRDTMLEGYVAVRSFQNEVKELNQALLKDVRFDFDKVVSENLNPFKERY
jgi:hypothetical protein